MRQRITVLVAFSAAMVIAILSYSAHVSATLQSGVTSTMLAPKSTLAPFEVFNHAIVPNPKGDGDNDRDDKMLWLSMQATKGPSLLHCEQYVAAGRPDDKSRSHHGLALAPWSQPDRRDSGDSDGL